MTTAILQLSPLTDALAQQYHALTQQNEYPPPMGSPDGYLLVVDESHTLIAAVTVIRTSGPYIMFEDYVLNKGVPQAVRWRANELMMEHIISLCTSAGKAAYCPVTFEGIVPMFERYGFEVVPTHTCIRMPRPFPLDEVMEQAPPPPLREVPKPAPEPAPEPKEGVPQVTHFDPEPEGLDEDGDPVVVAQERPVRRGGDGPKPRWLKKMEGKDA